MLWLVVSAEVIVVVLLEKFWRIQRWPANQGQLGAPGVELIIRAVDGVVSTDRVYSRH